MTTPAAIRARLTPLLAVMLGLALATSVSACDGCGTGTSLGKARGGTSKTKDKDTLSAKQILQKGGLCKEDRQVDEAEKGSEEWVILRIYELALGADTDEAFDEFRALFPDGRNARQLKEMYWPRIRKNVHKYMNEPGEVGYTICRTMATDRGRKFYIKSNDPRQFPPPIEIGERDGEKKILAFTPF